MFLWRGRNPAVGRGKSFVDMARLLYRERIWGPCFAGARWHMKNEGLNDCGIIIWCSRMFKVPFTQVDILFSYKCCRISFKLAIPVAG